MRRSPEVAKNLIFPNFYNGLIATIFSNPGALQKWQSDFGDTVYDRAAGSHPKVSPSHRSYTRSHPLRDQLVDSSPRSPQPVDRVRFFREWILYGISVSKPSWEISGKILFASTPSPLMNAASVAA
jgi:hypothetical protein